MVGFDNSIFCLALHPGAKPRSGVDRGRDRVNFLIETLKAANERIIIPMPALAEFLILAGTEAPRYLEIIRETSIFRLEPFDERAAIELANMEFVARQAGEKRGSASDSEWQKVKFDRQIAAISKVHGVQVLYSDDPDIKKHGEDCGVHVIGLADLPLPPAVQTSLFEKQESANGAPEATITSADTAPVQESSSKPLDGEASAETAKEAANVEAPKEKEGLKPSTASNPSSEA